MSRGDERRAVFFGREGKYRIAHLYIALSYTRLTIDVTKNVGQGDDADKAALDAARLGILSARGRRTVSFDDHEPVDAATLDQG